MKRRPLVVWIVGLLALIAYSSALGGIARSPLDALRRVVHVFPPPTATVAPPAAIAAHPIPPFTILRCSDLVATPTPMPPHSAAPTNSSLCTGITLRSIRAGQAIGSADRVQVCPEGATVFPVVVPPGVPFLGRVGDTLDVGLVPQPLSTPTMEPTPTTIKSAVILQIQANEKGGRHVLLAVPTPSVPGVKVLVGRSAAYPEYPVHTWSQPATCKG